MKAHYYLGICLICLAINFSCTSTDSPQITQKVDDDSTETIFIEDRTGKLWDITHAVNTWNMNPDFFRFGLGPNAIQPLNDPEFLRAGDRGFPVETGDFPIIGVNFEGEQRAYPISIVLRFEIVNDHIGDIYYSSVY